jgi:hypothetical protein
MASKKNKTKKADMFQYIKLYAGPDFALYSNYAKVLLILYVTFMYGILLPVMFPIAAIAIFNIFVTDTLMLTYWYQKPPMYDDKLYTEALEILKLAPLLMFGLGYWAMSN